VRCFPQADGTVCEMRSEAEGGARLNCNGGLGSATFVTGAFGFGGGGFCGAENFGRLNPGPRGRSPRLNLTKHTQKIFFDARGKWFRLFAKNSARPT